jgi:hypothetical protein
VVHHQGRLPVPGADLFYETEGVGTPVVLLHGRIPRAQAITVPNAGHMVNLEAVDVVNTILRDAVALAG